MKPTVSSLIATSFLLLPTLVSAQELGQKGDVVFSAERLMGITGSHRVTEAEPLPDEEEDWTSLSFGFRGEVNASPFDVPRIAFDYLVIDHLSIGGSLGYASLSPDEGNDVAMFLLAPRVGYVLSFGRVVGIWPRGGFTYHSTSVDDGYSESGVALSLECPFTFTPTSHFAFHVGPAFDIDMFGELDPNEGPDVDRKFRSIGVHAGLLGWF